MGWGPCLSYTAPLLLTYIGATKRKWKNGLKVGLVFSMGRLLALAILGGLATVAFSFINRFFPPHRSGWIYLIVALFMVTIGILIILGKGLKMHIGGNILDRGTRSIFIFGFLMGILSEKLFKSAKLYKAFQVVCGVVLVLFGFQLIYYVLNIVI